MEMIMENSTIIHCSIIIDLRLGLFMLKFMCSK